MTNPNLLKKAIGILFLFTAGFAFSQTGIKITYYTGTEQNYAIETSGKLYFSGDNLMVQTSGTATATSIPTTIIKNIVFSTNALATTETKINKNIILYPNPSSDIIKIASSNSSKAMSVKIYSAGGQLVHSGNYKSNENISIEKLSAGVYLINVDGTTLKLIKK